MDAWLQNNLVCPRDRTVLTETESQLCCARHHRYPIIEDVPILLVEVVSQTLSVADASLRQKDGVSDDPYRIATLGISDNEKTELKERILSETDSIDPVVSFLVPATNGIAYRHLIGKLTHYPIPNLRLSAGHGALFLDIGCGWGRWSIAAARKGYVPVGLDPSLGAVLAA